MELRTLKTAPAGGQNRAAWVVELYEDFKSEFERIRLTGLKFNMNLLLLMDRKIVKDSTLSICGTYINWKLISENFNTR